MTPERSTPERLALLAPLAAGALFATAAVADAQEGTITGRVTSAQDLEPLDGAQVFLPDTDFGTLSDEEGRFRITGVPAGEARVRVRLLGYRQRTRTVEVPPGGSVTANFQLQIAAVSLEEVVVTATGEQRNRELGNTVAVIDGAEQVDRKGSGTLADLVQGEATGVNIRPNSGSAGAAPSFRIRGNSSISLDNTPLVYVDGARISNSTSGSGQQGQSFSRLNDLRPEDIESIEIVKGPAASTLYGTEAAAGVLRITTRRGTSDGSTRVQVRGELGANWDHSRYPSVVWHPRSLGLPSDTIYTMNLIEEREPFRTGEIATAAASVRGGGEGSRYYASGEWTTEEGTAPNNGVEKWSARANLGLDPSDLLDVDISTGFTSSFAGLPDNDNNVNGFVPISIVSFPWTQPLTRQGVRSCPLNVEIARALGVPLAELPDVNEDIDDPFDGCADNPGFGGLSFDDIATRRNEQDVERFTGSAVATLSPADWLTGRATVGYDEFSQRTRNIVPVDAELPFGDDSRGFVQRQDVTSRNLTLEGDVTAEYDITGDLSATSTAGVQWFNETAETTFALGRNFPAGSPTVGNSVENEGDDAFAEEKTLGVFLQQQFNWRDRLFVTPALRLDDNSAFGEEADLQDLKKISVSYVISDEAWFPELFETMRLRGAWGESAKQPGTNDALTLLTSAPTIDGGSERLGVLRDRPGNPELKPETGDEFELGFDASVLEGRLGVEFTFYDQTTSDAIVQRSLAPSEGFPGQQFTNIGETVNRGIEASVDAVALDLADLRWDWRVNVSTNHNEITELDSPIVFDFGNSSTNGQRHEEGRSFGAYVHRPVRINDQGEVEVGDELVTSGQPTPEWTGSVSTTVTLFENVSLYGLLDFAGGHQLFNNNAEFTCTFLGGGTFGGTCPDLFDADASGAGVTDEARIKQVAAANLNEFPFVEDADFARLRTVSLSLDAPSGWTEFVRASSARLTVSIENAALFTGYSGLDPEANEFGGDENAARAEFLTQPLPRRFLATLSLSF
ncbi:MAG: TonB-dependent receptor domain-containing protein [Gemmatimonadota bacterium]